MDARLGDVLRQLDASRDVLRDAMDRVPVDRRRTRPGPGRWSVAEVLEHLARVDRLFAARITRAIDEARAAGRATGTAIPEPLADAARQRMLDRSARRDAPAMARPSGALDAAQAWDDLERARQEVRAAASGGEDLALDEIRTEHRVFGSLSVCQWVELTAAHETRHADQIREIGETLDAAR